MASQLRLVQPARPAQALSLDGLVGLRKEMQEALRRGDWLWIQRLDRLCGQTLRALSAVDPDTQVALLRELREIQLIYAQAIGELDRQMAQDSLSL